MSKPISYQPTDGLSYDPADKKYWDPEALQKEITRTFEICHGCRMCFKFCDSFPDLFDFIDNRHDGDVEKITAEETEHVMNECFQCKLCEVQCPYTVRDQHEYQLDFPRLVHRYSAQKVARDGVSFQHKVLGDPDATGKMARASLGMANTMNRVGIHRWFMEKALGIHRDKLLPDFAGKTFESWAEAEGLIPKTPQGEAVLFQTCYVQNNEPEIGQDTIDVLQKNQVEVSCAKGLQCCGMPAWEHGDLKSLQSQAAENLKTLEPYVDAGAKVLVINPTCAMMMRREYPELVDVADRERAKKVADAVMDPSEFLWSIRKEDRFNDEFKSTPGEVAYHAPCHLRAQGVGFKGRDLLKKIPGLKPSTTMECCGHDGTYAMTVDGFEPSQRIGKKAIDGVKEPEKALCATDCPLAAIQFEQHAGKKGMHPMSILARAYRSDGFDQAVEVKTETPSTK
ncbi:MAG: hypothetical protein HKN21_14355 [Candidatus Eisenbacteria bacterium]|uniref:4Fe-4S ferredoxin-type domain-containing protein n=1 Tax=Eiseniibacteriota bacterium TaxID=2212470 RepID=A0A7Y2H3K8_UNCEI|nr:hypothetical protein [Candidatus Eisenbacteria bacterium]